jgi:thioredoxin reductase (NADPH)
MEEATFLAKFATKVTLVHRRDEFRASQDHDRLRPVEAEPRVRHERRRRRRCSAQEGKMTGVALRDTVTGEEREMRPAASSSRSATTRPPRSSRRARHGPSGYLLTRDGSTETNIEGVFAAGDVVDHVYRQAVTAAGMGCMAALDAERWLSHAHGAAATAGAAV